VEALAGEDPDGRVQDQPSLVDGRCLHACASAGHR
jgi:hypothetical protein